MHYMMLKAIFFVVALSSLCTVTNAQYSGGSGKSGDPYQIATTDDLIELSNANSTSWQNHYFIQTADIVFPEDSSSFDWDGDGTIEWNGDGSGDDELGFKPIGTSSAIFWNVYNGQHYSIYNLYINRPSGDFSNPTAMFGHVGYFRYGTGNIINVRLKNVRIKGGDYTACLVAVGGSYDD